MFSPRNTSMHKKYMMFLLKGNTCCLWTGTPHVCNLALSLLKPCLTVNDRQTIFSLILACVLVHWAVLIKYYDLVVYQMCSSQSGNWKCQSKGTDKFSI